MAQKTKMLNSHGHIVKPCFWKNLDKIKFIIYEVLLTKKALRSTEISS